jgi:PST family polysaccharide transporter
MKISLPAFKNIVHSVLFKNYIYLSVYQVVNFLVPIVIVPIIISRVGLEKFGLIAFSYAFVNYFTVLTDYGFNLSATKNVSVHRHDPHMINRIFTTVMLSKLLFFALSFLLFSILLLIPIFQDHYQLHLASYMLVLAQVLIPVWLFQGLEDMKYLAVFNTMAKILYAVLIIFW